MLSVFGAVTAVCDDSAAATEITDSPSAIAPLSLGFELYQGTSNLAGVHRLTDGMWAGNGAYFPSVTYVEWTGLKGDVMKASIGVGRLYTEKESGTNQPVEAYWKKPLGKSTLTVGKFYIPFAQQEWLYLAQWGAMTEWTSGRVSFSASANYNKNLDRPNFYAKGNYQVAEDAQVALSLAAGKGFCTDSSHGRGVALDTNVGFKGWRFCGEYNHYDAGTSGDAFDFLSGKLYYEKFGKWKPFIAKYWWKDDCGELGNFRSNVIGADYELSPWLTIQGAISDTSDGTVSWLQFTSRWHTPLFRR
jgi:hypothetical protein